MLQSEDKEMKFRMGRVHAVDKADAISLIFQKHKSWLIDCWPSPVQNRADIIWWDYIVELID